MPAPRRRTSTPTRTSPILAPRRRRVKHNLLPNRDNPLMLQKLRSCRPLHLVALEAASQEVDSGVAELIARRQGGLVALRDVVHDCPFVVQ